MKKIQFYFDVISPYVWLASKQMPEFEKQHNIEFIWTPVLFAGLLNAHRNLGPAEISAKRNHTLKDAIRWAIHYGFPYQGPPEHPFNPLKALRLLTVIEDNKIRSQFATALLQGIWEQGLNVNQEEQLIKLLEANHLEGKNLLEQTSNAQIKEKLRENTKLAVFQGVFGVPTFIVDQELFWGHDRFILLADYLSGKPFIDSEKFQEILKRPRGADRTQVIIPPLSAPTREA